MFEEIPEFGSVDVVLCTLSRPFKSCQVAFSTQER